MKIPLRNRQKEIIDYAIVSKIDFEHLNKFKWSKNPGGYARSTINGKTWLMHRYIMIVLLGNDLVSKQHVDHINNNKLDNKRKNLRIATTSENSRNRTKQENTSSIYNNVGFHKISGKWLSRITTNDGNKLYAAYDKELDAAWQVNLWIIKHDLIFANKNVIKEPKNFIIYKSKPKKDLPKGITKSGNIFRVSVKRKEYGRFDKLEDAIVKLEAVRAENEKIKNDKLLSTPILYNENNQCIFKVKENEIIIDENIYYDIIKYKWQINNGYAQGNINSKITQLHRYIMNYNGNDYIDHINGNRLDNTRANLRIVTHSQNSMNKKKMGGSSQYIGVTLNKCTNKWTAYIKIEGKNKHLGTFVNEVDAAKARDIATKKYFGEYGNLNFPVLD